MSHASNVIPDGNLVGVEPKSKMREKRDFVFNMEAKSRFGPYVGFLKHCAYGSTLYTVCHRDLRECDRE